MLTTTLRDLERDGSISLEVFAEVPPRAEYELTTLGVSLQQPMKHLVEWTMQNWKEIKRVREKFDLRANA